MLIYVEDPGAANYVAGLPVAFASQGITTRLLADGPATDYLQQRGILSQSVFPFSFFLSPFSCVLIGTSENPDSFGLELTMRCRQSGACSVGVIDAFANAAYRFRGRTDDPLAYAPDWLLVPDAWTRDAYTTLGYPANRIVICGHPHYDAARREKTRLAGIGRETLRREILPDAARERPVIVFVAEVSTGLDAAQFQRSLEYTLHGRGHTHKRTEIVIEEFLDAIAQMQPRPYLVLRLHPKNTRAEFARYLSAFDVISEGTPPLRLIYAADAVVGMTSMLLLEAALLARPTLAIVPRACEADWLPTIRAGLTPCATTRPELHAQLAQILLQTTPADADIDTVVPCGAVEHITRFAAERLASRY